MSKKKIVKNFFIIFCLIIISIFIYSKFSQKKNTVQSRTIETKDEIYTSNIIKNVNYVTKDAKGNEYHITAEKGEIDYSNSNILYLTKVKALIRLINSDNISINSKYGKYNSDNFDTIFSKNVIINYLDNKIQGEYLDFSLDRNSLLISKKVVYTNLDNILKADVIEIDIKTKDTKIFMYQNQDKVSIKNIN
tara:strand:+ start:4240 stop:4815 length:576 start_codon:yes stop_codon:yes gene_type:complete